MRFEIVLIFEAVLRFETVLKFETVLRLKIYFYVIKLINNEFGSVACLLNIFWIKNVCRFTYIVRV